VADETRSSDSRDSAADVRIDRESFDRRDIGGDASSGLIKLRSCGLGVSLLSLLFVLSSFFPKMVLNDGAAGLSFGVAGRWEDGGRVPMGACTGRWSS
jgi:hypothetical protein